MASKKKASSGSSLVEGILAMLTLTVFGLEGFPLLYQLGAKMWIEHTLNESLMCLAEGQSVSICRSYLARRIDHTLPLGKITHLKLNRNHTELAAQLEYSTLGDKVIKLSQVMPLQEGFR